MKPQITRTVVIGVATRPLREGEIVFQGDVIVEGYAQVCVDAPPVLIKQWRREKRRRAMRSFLRAVLHPFASVRVPLIHLLGGLDAAEVVREVDV